MTIKRVKEENITKRNTFIKKQIHFAGGTNPTGTSPEDFGRWEPCQKLTNSVNY